MREMGDINRYCQAHRVIPAKAGASVWTLTKRFETEVPAFAGMTPWLEQPAGNA